ncbi:hypothetical protein V8F20_001400, partial [Naviculisporaceae sp. PSN 640]
MLMWLSWPHLQSSENTSVREQQRLQHSTAALQQAPNHRRKNHASNKREELSCCRAARRHIYIMSSYNPGHNRDPGVREEEARDPLSLASLPAVLGAASPPLPQDGQETYLHHVFFHPGYHQAPGRPGERKREILSLASLPAVLGTASPHFTQDGQETHQRSRKLFSRRPAASPKPKRKRRNRHAAGRLGDPPGPAIPDSSNPQDSTGSTESERKLLSLSTPLPPPCSNISNRIQLQKSKRWKQRCCRAARRHHHTTKGTR